LIASACGGAKDPSPDAGLPDAGSTAADFFINGAGGIVFTQAPLDVEGKGLLGHLYVTKKASPHDVVTTATATLNGATIPVIPVDSGRFLLTGMDLPTGAAPGGTLTLAAAAGGKTTSFQMVCPGGLDITAPAEGASVSAGATVHVTFQGKVKYASGLFAPVVQIRGYGSGANTADDAVSTSAKALNLGDTSADIVAPATSKTGYVVELAVPGDNVVAASDPTSNNTGLCSTVRRIPCVDGA